MQDCAAAQCLFCTQLHGLEGLSGVCDHTVIDIHHTVIDILNVFLLYSSSSNYEGVCK